jgi:hypothetical protein
MRGGKKREERRLKEGEKRIPWEEKSVNVAVISTRAAGRNP